MAWPLLLVRAMRFTNVTSFHVELASHRPKLIKQALALTGNMADAEDLVHAGFERALERRLLFRADTRLDAWLATVIHNLAMDLFRRPWHKRSARLDVLELPMSVPEAPRWWEEISDQDVRRALVRCSSAVREAFELRHYSGLSLAGIASRTGAPIRTVATRIFRARAQVRRVLESERRGGPGRQAAAPAARRAAG